MTERYLRGGHICNAGELAEALFEMKQAWAGNNADFAACLISCATTIADNDGLQPDDIRRIFSKNVQAALQVCAERRARKAAAS